MRLRWIFVCLLVGCAQEPAEPVGSDTLEVGWLMLAPRDREAICEVDRSYSAVRMVEDLNLDMSVTEVRAWLDERC